MVTEINTEINLDKLAQTAKLSLSEAEKSKIEKYLEYLIKDFDKLSEVSTDGATPMIYVTEQVNELREDKAMKKIDKETLLANAPEHVNGYFKAPQAVE